MKKMIILLTLFGIILVGCAGENNTPKGFDGLTSEMIEVKLSTEPEQLMPKEPVKIVSEVTLEGEPVEDADEVFFEIWADGMEDQSVKIDSRHDGEGVYSISYSFENTGVYYVVSHVTDGAMHNMPKLKLVIGDVPGEETGHEQIQHDADMENMDHMGH